MRKGKSVRQEDGTERVVRTKCLRGLDLSLQRRGAEPRRANRGGETGDDALNGEQTLTPGFPVWGK